VLIHQFVFKVRYGLSTISPRLIEQSSVVGSKEADDPSTIPIVKPTFGTAADYNKIKSTWLGHAAFLLELPSVRKEEGSRGLTFLCDPVFSQRCSPVQFAGPPPRVTRKLLCPVALNPEADIVAPPAKVSELPEVDVVVSHSSSHIW